MKDIDDLFDLIDNKLIELYEAPTQKYYKVFDFKTLLSILSDELVKHGYNEHYKKKASQVIAVFNDLCNTVIESYHYRDLSYNETTKEIETENVIHNTITNETETIKFKRAAGELAEYFSKKDLPEKYHSPLTETCKLDYHLRECQKDYSSFYPAVSRGYSGGLNNENDVATYIYIMGDILRKNDKFENCFSIDINIQWKYKISFEAYVDQIYKKRAVLEAVGKPLPSRDKGEEESIEEHIPAIQSLCNEKENDIKMFLNHGGINRVLSLKDEATAKSIASIILPLIDRGVFPQVEKGSTKTEKSEFLRTNFGKSFKNAITEYYENEGKV
ncbi:hypothetical protein [Parabacteroides sp. PF5-9]|uniref:hypothetical protein n=1 Tax=Parabacteroides sp. PF5-9 TaxID=1742404 RepID=UPI00247342F1|nr:hypothetical protein [Parabacteroides sp. PF5-9]MDH6357638.1 hypothetical protein [Parabacteroides sp. PF5-9]